MRLEVIYIYIYFLVVVSILLHLQFLLKHKFLQVQHLPNLPYLALYEFLFLKLKMNLKDRFCEHVGHLFQSFNEVVFGKK